MPQVIDHSRGVGVPTQRKCNHNRTTTRPTSNEPQTAIQEGFSRAFVTIVDANVTTLIASIILYAIGTGPVKGFAITLSIGILTSMFTAILGTRAIINIMYGNKNLKELRV